jgi:hypothetical protein
VIKPSLLRQTRHVKPATRKALWNWVFLHTGVKIARNAVCCGHHAPFDWFATCQLERPKVSLVLGARGSGKSFLSSIDTHCDSRWNPKHATKILGGSQAQAKQIHAGLGDAILRGIGPGPWNSTDADQIRSLGIETAHYVNGSTVEIMTASPLSVRGPHVPCLRMDEVDEIATEIREAAMGGCMAKNGYSAKLSMSSTWHKLGGEMTTLIESAREHKWPFFTFCSFEVLERCPESRSGPFVGGDALYENCPACPLKPWCHKDRDLNGNQARAKLADGHYKIDSLIQKVETLSARMLEADYFCSGPRADGLWFTDWNPHLHISEEAEYRRNLPVHIAIDTGVRTGGVWFQVKRDVRAAGVVDAEVNVFADYYQEHLTPELHVHGSHNDPSGRETEGFREICARFCEGRADFRWTDPAGKARNQSGTVVIGQFAAAGWQMQPWPKVGVTDALFLVESLLKTADGKIRLKVHPRCVNLINAFNAYRRAKVKGVWQDYPEEPQHPQENLIDPLKNGLVAVIGRHGLRPQPVHDRIHASQVI